MNLEMLVEQKKIVGVLLAYAQALDGRYWAGLADVFSAEALADYRGIGVFEGREAIVDVVRD